MIFRPKIRKGLLVAMIVVGVVLAIVGSYLTYLQVNYTRIPDNTPVQNEGATPQTTELRLNTPYTAMTYNIGFGAYTPDYTFFMDTGTMEDGTPTRGEHGVAVSEESVASCTQGAIEVARGIADGKPADLMLFQEVDTDSTRSHHVNQHAMIEEAFPTCAAFYAENFHSGFLVYPIPEFHGSVRAGLLSLSDAQATAVRRSYPIDESFPLRYTDLDRCFCVMRMPVEGGRELVLINSHMSAYDEGGVVRAQQMELFRGVIADEYAKGNYVVAGGDWNHALCDSQELYESDQLVPDWVSLFDESALPPGFRVVQPLNLAEVATCRGADIPYESGTTYEVTVDGFVVSDNVRAEARNVDTGYAFSDHNPVLLNFSLV